MKRAEKASVKTLFTRISHSLINQFTDSGFTDLLPSLPLFLGTPWTRIRESSYRRSAPIALSTLVDLLLRQPEQLVLGAVVHDVLAKPADERQSEEQQAKSELDVRVHAEDVVTHGEQ